MAGSILGQGDDVVRRVGRDDRTRCDRQRPIDAKGAERRRAVVLASPVIVSLWADPTTFSKLERISSAASPPLCAPVLVRFTVTPAEEAEYSTVSVPTPPEGEQNNIRPDAGVSWAEGLLTDRHYACGDRGYRNSYREGNPRPKARRLNSAGFLRCSNIPSVEPPHHPPSLALRPASRSALRRLHERQQFVAVMLKLLVADAGDAAKLFKRRRSRRRDAVNR